MLAVEVHDTKIHMDPKECNALCAAYSADQLADPIRVHEMLHLRGLKTYLAHQAGWRISLRVPS